MFSFRRTLRSGPFRLTLTHRGATAGVGVGGFSLSTGRHRGGRRRRRSTFGTRVMCLVLALALLPLFWPMSVLFVLASVL